MIKRWILFLTLWFGCLFLYGISREWAALIVLEVMTLLPLLSYLVSLPAVRSAKLSVDVPGEVSLGSKVSFRIRITCSFPAPRKVAVITGHHSMTGEEFPLSFGGDLPTDHCGVLECRIEKARMYDYLGLFSFRLHAQKSFSVTVHPDPIPMPRALPNGDQPAVSWRPKPGGGYAENHELRPYRPGDSLKQIHWKMSAKMGDWVYREAMIPNTGGILVWTILSGDADEIDRKLGRLLWLSRDLAHKNLKHDVLVYTGNGVKRWAIDSKFNAEEMMVGLLRQSPVKGEVTQSPGDNALWKIYVGGEEHEKI